MEIRSSRGQINRIILQDRQTEHTILAMAELFPSIFTACGLALGCHCEMVRNCLCPSLLICGLRDRDSDAS